MIKLSIKSKIEPEEEGFKGVLNLEQQFDGSVVLTMSDKVNDRYPWNILRIKTDGTFERSTSLPGYIGLQVDRDGKIIEGKN